MDIDFKKLAPLELVQERAAKSSRPPLPAGAAQ